MKANWMFVWALLPALPALAEDKDVALMLPAERQAIQRQSAEMFAAAGKLTEKAGASTVWLYTEVEKPRVTASTASQVFKLTGRGTVVGDGRTILVKWSDIVGKLDGLHIVDAERKTHPVALEGVYQEFDIAKLVLTDGTTLPAIEWSNEPAPQLGRMLLAVNPTGETLGMGVVSVNERNLRETDQPFLGVIADPEYTGAGARVGNVEPGSGAAEAGLRKGDVIMQIADRAITGVRELRNALLGKKSGDRVPLIVIRNGKEESVEVLLGNRPHFLEPINPRLEMMKRMGGRVSKVSENFPNVVQTDMQIDPTDCGGPVVDLKGRVVGVMVARTDRTRSFMIPAASIKDMLAKAPQPPSLAKLEENRIQDANEALPPNQRMIPPRDLPSRRQVRQAMREMAQALQHLEDELEEIGE